MGVPDDARAKLVYATWRDVPRTVMQGSASFLGQVTDPPWQLQPVYFGAPRLELPPQMRRLPCVNFLADADLYPRALQQAQAFVRGMDTPCFNPPEAVLGTTRDRVHQQLKNTPGVQMPVTVRARASRLVELQAAMADAGIEYPVLVRMAGDHGGVSTAQVRDANDWEAINPLPWGGRDVYLTQFVDYRDADGRYRKTRLVVVGDTVHTRHLIVSAGWMVHRKERLPGTEDEERDWLEGFAVRTLPRIAPAVREIARGIGLDYFGIDCSLRPDGSLLIFEANACMNVLARTGGEGPTMWDAPLAGIRASLDRVLGDVRQWRSLRAPAGVAP